MTKRKDNRPTESELEILQLLWQKGALTVRQANELLNQKKETGYTTTLKIMQIMAEKKLVDRDTSTRTHIYTAAVSEEETQSSLLNQFTKSAFRGSAMQLVMRALGQNDASQEELDAIKALIAKKESETK